MQHTSLKNLNEGSRDSLSYARKSYDLIQKHNHVKKPSRLSNLKKIRTSRDKSY